jgi:hypothetical protein
MGNLPKRPGQAELDQRRRHEALREPAQIRQQRIDVAIHLLDELSRASRVVEQKPFDDAQLHSQGDHALLCAVVEISLDALPLRHDRGDFSQVRRIDLGIETMAFERHLHAARDGLEQRRFLEERDVVNQRGRRRTTGIEQQRRDAPVPRRG